MIRFDNVGKCYANGGDALSELSFEIGTGEINYKQLFKQFENPEAYTNFKEVMRILRKIKYENKT